MFKSIARANSKKQNMHITLQITKIGVEVDKDRKFQIQWNRGKDMKEQGNVVSINNIENEVQCSDIFKKVSSFYSKDGISWEPKMCEFKLVEHLAGGETKEVAKVDFNMSPYVYYTTHTEKIELESSLYGNTFIEAVWTIHDTKESKGQANSRIRAESQILNSRSSIMMKDGT